jgi:hypothetical protein
MRLIRNSYRMIGYQISALIYQFVKQKSIREEAFLDRLRMNGVTLPGLNVHLDNTGFPDSIGRFPGLLEDHEAVMDRVDQYMADFHRSQKFENMSPNERRRHLSDYVADELAQSLSLDPKLFSRFYLVPSE